MTETCHRCGRSILRGYKFCKFCGSSTLNEARVSPPVWKKRTRNPLVAAFLVALFAAGLLIWIIASRTKPTWHPVLSFSASSQQIVKGEQCRLQWSVDSPAIVQLDGSNVPASGSRVMSPEETTTYRLVASGPRGASESREVTVQVIRIDVPPAIEFSGDRAKISSGQSVRLRWSVTGATQVKFEPDLDGLPVQGEHTVSPRQHTEYSLTAAGPGGTVTSHFKVLVSSPSPPTIEFTGDRQQVTTGQALTLHWSVTNANSVRIDPGFEALPTQGERTVSPTHTTEFVLTAQGSGGISSKRLTVRIGPKIAVFEAVPNSIEQCKIAMLRWTVYGATAVSIEPEIGPANPSTGYKVVRPLQTMRYVLKADGPDGSVSREVIISVVHATRSACSP